MKEEELKRKYYSALEEISAYEDREQGWVELEKKLNNGLRRLIVAALGIDDELDEHLESLQKLVRARSYGDEFADILENIQRSLDHSGRDYVKKPETSVATIVIDIFGAVSFPRELRKKANQLLSKIKKQSLDDAQICALAIELIDEAVNLKPDHREAPIGVIGKAFQSIAESARSRIQQHHNGIGGGGCEDFELPKAVLHEMLSGLADVGLASGKIEQFRNEISKSDNMESLKGIARQMSVALARMNNSKLDERAHEEVHKLIDAVLGVVDKIVVPSSHKTHYEVIQRKIKNGIQVSEWPDTLNEIAEILIEARNEAEAEKGKLDEFLLELTNSLKVVDRNLREIEGEREDEVSDSKKLNEAVGYQVSGIRDGLSNAESIDQVKGIVLGRLREVGYRLAEFMESVDRRSLSSKSRLEEMKDRISELEGEAKALREDIEREKRNALLDPLTGIANRTSYDEHLSGELASHINSGVPFSLFVFDIDHFKNVNDTYGHVAGDKVLKTLADLVSSKVRAGDFFARYGGEEFVILMPGTPPEESYEIAESIRCAVEECGFHYRSEPVPISISGGLAQLMRGDDGESLFARADKRLYEAKRTGRNQISKELDFAS